MYKQRNKQYRECGARGTDTISEMIKNSSFQQFTVLTLKHVICNGLYSHFIFSAVNLKNL